MKRSIPSLTKLKKLKRDYRDEHKGYRERKYTILAEALRIAVDLRSDGLARKAFLQLSGTKPAKPNGKDSIGSLTAAVVIFVMSAKSKSQCKQAWKYARGLDYLRDEQNVEIDDIPAAILERHGIEAISRLAAKENPRRAKKDVPTKTSILPRPSSKTSAAEDSGDDQSIFAEEDHPGPSPDGWPSRVKDPAGGDEGTMLVGISGELRAKLKVARGRRAKLIGTIPHRGGWGEHTLFQVEKVVSLVKRRRMRWGPAV